MKIYEYMSSTDGSILKVKEIEAEEKEKTYRVTSRSSWRKTIKKDEVGKLLDGYVLNMYLTERDDEKYINTLIEFQQSKVDMARQKLKSEEIKLENYKARIKRAEVVK